MLDPKLIAFLEQGLALHIGTRNARLEPNGARVTAVKVDPVGMHLLAFIPKAASRDVLQNLQENGQAAIAFARPSDDRACQVKGVFVDVRDATAADRPMVLEQWRGCQAQFAGVGIPVEATSTWQMWPCIAVRIRVTMVFDQTPGPGAGAPVAVEQTRP